MCDVLDRVETRGLERGRIEGRVEGARMEREQNARGMQAIGMTVEQIAAALQIDIPAARQLLQ